MIGTLYPHPHENFRLTLKPETIDSKDISETCPDGVTSKKRLEFTHPGESVFLQLAVLF